MVPYACECENESLSPGSFDFHVARWDPWQGSMQCMELRGWAFDGHYICRA